MFNRIKDWNFKDIFNNIVFFIVGLAGIVMYLILVSFIGFWGLILLGAIAGGAYNYLMDRPI